MVPKIVTYNALWVSKNQNIIKTSTLVDTWGWICHTYRKPAHQILRHTVTRYRKANEKWECRDEHRVGKWGDGTNRMERELEITAQTCPMEKNR